MSKPNWLIISPISGQNNGSITNTATPHTGRVERSGVVTLQGEGGVQASYKVFQSPAEEFITCDTNQFSVSSAASSVRITGKSNSRLLNIVCDQDILPVNYEVLGNKVANGKTIPDDPGAVSEYEYAVTISIPQNTLTSEVSKTVVIKTENSKSVSITITQSASDIILRVEPTEITIPADGSAVTVNVVANTAWEVV